MMSDNQVTVAAIGGPTLLMEIAGLRLITDPTLDPPSSPDTDPSISLIKTAGPAIAADAIGPVDAVLLSHDHHLDNLDHAGRAMLPTAQYVLTTVAGAARLGGNAIGLAPWQEFNLLAPNGNAVHVTATPARHGPASGDRGPVIGFVLSVPGRSNTAMYISGDTVWFDGVAEVSRRFPVGIAVLFMGAARVAASGSNHITFTADEGVLAARAFTDAAIVPVHYEGWKHFSENRVDIERSFAEAGLAHRLRWLEQGCATTLPL